MGDIFVEQIIKRNLSVGGLMLRTLSIIVFVVSLLAIPALGMLGLTICILLGYVIYLTFTYTSVEYEYSFVNGEISIDKILGKSKRKRGEDYDIRKATLIAKMDNPEIEYQANSLVKVDYSSGYKNDNKYGIVLNDVDGMKGALLVVIEPDEKLLDAMYHVRPNIVKK